MLFSHARQVCLFFWLHCVGLKYLDECPKEPNIPIYLLVGGGFGMLKIMSLLYRQMKLRQLDRLEETSAGYHPDLLVSDSTKYSEYMLSLFLLGWFIAGNVWVLRIYRPEFDQPLLDPKNWCDKTVYMFALVQILACYCVLAVVAVFSLALALCHRYTDSDPDPS